MKKTLSIILALLFIPSLASALTVELRVNSGRESINALEATLKLPTGMKVESLSDGNSALIIWVKKPEYEPSIAAVSFSGITPGGFSGSRRVLVLTGEFTRAEVAQIVFSGVSAFRNDGLGERVPVELGFEEITLLEDNDPPEAFELILSSSPEIENGSSFLSFSTQDKGRGVKNYEYASTWLLNPDDGDWQETNSPLLLTRSMLFQKISVLAIDEAGNAQVSTLSGPYRYAAILFGIIIILCVLLFLRRSFLSPRPSLSS